MIKFKLRRFKPGDERSLQKNINDKAIARNTLSIPYPYTLKDARAWIRRNLKLYRLKKKKELNLAIDINGEVAGGVGLHINWKHRNAELGYWLARRYWNKGIMTKAVQQFVKYGFSLGLKRIYAKVFPFNLASQKVLEKAGFSYEGRLKAAARKGNRYYDELLYAKIRS